jgi:hypothetical protein
MAHAGEHRLITWMTQKPKLFKPKKRKFKVLPRLSLLLGYIVRIQR